MSYTIRRALPEDVRPALDLALRVFIEYQMPYNDPEALENFKRDCIYNEDFAEQFRRNERFMFVAFENDTIIGLIAERGNGHIVMLYVDGSYHRKGIASLLMNQMVNAFKESGICRITLNAAPSGLSFYEHFGFRATDEVRHNQGFVVTPMEYIFTLNLTIRPLTPALAEDYAHFFDVTPHNNEFGHKCYCVPWRDDNSYELDGDHWFHTQEERREKAIGYVKSGALQGYLAYSGDEIVGWCNANANCQLCLDYLRGFWDIDEYNPAVKIKSVFCFAIAPEMQRRGVATQLLQRVCHDAAEENYDFVEAYTSVDFAHDGFHGPLALYEKCGFVRHTVKNDYVVMRKTLKK